MEADEEDEGEQVEEEEEEEEEQAERGDQKQQEVSMETGPGERRGRGRKVKRMDAGVNERIVPIWTLGDPHRPSRHTRAASSSSGSSSFMVVFGPRGSDS